MVQKTLILHNNDYKKYSSQPSIIGGDLVPQLTSNTNGQITVTDSGAASGRDGWKLFDKSTTNTSNYYGTQVVPSWVKIDFGENNQKVIYSFDIEFGDVNPNDYLTDWELQGSNDDSTWTSIYSIVGDNGWTRNGIRTFTVDSTKENPYRYIRLYISRFVGTSIGRIKEMVLLGRDIQGNSQWENVSSTLPTSIQFIEDGMDSLSPLFDRAVQNLNPQEMTLDSTFVGEGKLFRKSVNLNKYFDIRTISTEKRNS